jgi:hypothetical protein
MSLGEVVVGYPLRYAILTWGGDRVDRSVTILAEFHEHIYGPSTPLGMTQHIAVAGAHGYM